MNGTECFDWLAVMAILATGIAFVHGPNSQEAAFIQLLPEEKRKDYKKIIIPPQDNKDDLEIAIEAHGLTWRPRKWAGYMSQAFSLYSKLTVRQNLELHAKLFHTCLPQIFQPYH